MKQIKSLFIVWTGCIFTSCVKQSSPYVLDIPDKIETAKADRYQSVRVKGTCLFVIPPQGFVQAEKQNALTYNEALYIYFSEAEKQNVNHTIDVVLERLRQLYTYEKDGYWKIFELNGYKALATHLKCENEEAELSVIFGNQFYSAQVECRYPLAYPSLQEILLKSMLTVYVDTVFKELAIDDMAYYTIDLSGTDFKLAYYSNNTYIYTINGIDPTPGPHLDFSISVTTMPYDSPPEKMVKYIKDKTFYPYKIQKKIVNDYSGVEFYSEGSVSGKTAKAYSVIFGNGMTSLYVCGRIYNPERYNEFLPEFKRIIQTIRFKNK